MGEVIDILSKIRLGNSELCVELNKSASGEIYRDIHIQNESFRIEIPENEFIIMAAGVLYAKKQMDLIKMSEKSTEPKINVHEGQYVDEKKVTDFFEMLNENKIGYVLLHNIGNELPQKLVKGKDIDIVVNRADYKELVNALEKNGFEKVNHPKGVGNGYLYAYGLEECCMWKNPNAGLVIDICFKLYCHSLTENVLVPLNEDINRELWAMKKWNEKLQCWEPDSVVKLVYLITRSIFDKHGFSDSYIEEINKVKHLLKETRTQALLNNIVYSFSKKLTQMIMENNYENIFSEYISHKQY